MKKILVVEDSSTVLTMLKKEFAKHENIEVFYAQSYEDATKIVNKNPDIKTALLDINLPQMLQMVRLLHLQTYTLSQRLF